MQSDRTAKSEYVFKTDLKKKDITFIKKKITF